MKKRVADIVMDILVDNGIENCFLVVGGGAMYLDNALALNKKINKICNHHEQACTMAAEAYARLTGKMAAACVTSGPGATNAITGVMGAWQDSIPLIVLSGQVRYEISSMITGLPLRYRGIQEFDIVTSVKNMTKYAVMITDPLSIRKEMNKAINIAMNGRRGPVWIDIPLDIQSAIVETDKLYKDEINQLDEYQNQDDLIIRAIKLLKEAKRPCILGGTGIVSSVKQYEFEKFVNKLQIPVIGGGWCTDMLYTDHPLYYGLSGDIGPRAGNFILQNADVILVLGNSLSFRQTGYNQEMFASNAKIVWVEVDKTETMKPGMKTEIFIHLPLDRFFNRFNDLYKEKIYISKEWIEYCKKLKSRFTPYESIESPNEIDMTARVNAYYFWKILDKYLDGNQVIAMGNSRVNAAKIQIGVKKSGQRAITNYLCGSMGYELPAAVGCAVADRGTILCITGDGSIMMNLQELQTISHNNLSVKVVVFSNDGYEAIRQTCKNFFKGTYLGCTSDSGISFPNFEGIANAFGFIYGSCETNQDVDGKIQWLINTDDRVFLEVKQQLDNSLIPKVMSRINEDGVFSTPALHDMAPFLSNEELSSLMFS